MADVSILNGYNIKDKTARAQISEIIDKAPYVEALGITEDLNDCGALINQLIADGVKVFKFDNKTYTFTTPISANMSYVIFTGSLHSILLNNTGTYLFNNSYVMRSVIENVVIQGGNGISWVNIDTTQYNYSYNYIRNVLFYNNDVCINLAGRSGYNYIDQCVLRSNTQAVIIGNIPQYVTENVFITECQISGIDNNYPDGVTVDYAQYVHINNNDFTVLKNGVVLLAQSGNQYNCFIDHNTFTGVTESGVKVDSNNSSYMVRYTDISHNYFFSNDVINAIYSAGTRYANNTIIDSNAFSLTNSSSKAIYGTFNSPYISDSNTINGTNWYDRITGPTTPKYDALNLFTVTTVPTSGATVSLPTTSSTKWHKFTNAIVTPVSPDMSQYITSSINASTGAVTITNSHNASIQCIVLWL